MRSPWNRFGWSLPGAAFGAVIMACLLHWSKLVVIYTAPVLDLAQLAATLFLAFYIPMALETQRDNWRSVRGLFVDQSKLILEVVRTINATVTRCAHSGETAPDDLMVIRTRFQTADGKVASFQARVKAGCSEKCVEPLNAFRRAYNNYYRAVTGGSLYGGKPVDYDLWRKQEAAFLVFENSVLDLIHTITKD